MITLTNLNINLSVKTNKRSIMMLVIPLALSGFTHIWNPIGFPSVFLDEGIYMRRAMQVMEGHSTQESLSRYDHPYFGQIFLAFIFKIIGYPDSLNPKPGDVHSIEMLYLVPRVLMGLLAVVDTFLVYKISDRMYGRKVAFIASIFFAVMPMTWILRRIYLDSIQLPFLLSSIFFALYYTERPTSIISNKGTKFDIDDSNNKYKKIPVVVLSGIFLGLAIFTKIPVFMMIPLVAYLIYKNSTSIDRKGKLKTLGLWFIPVILIPAIWPEYNMLYGNFGEWVAGVLWQTDRIPRPMEDMIAYLLRLDTALLILGFAGIVFAVLRRDAFIILWTIPLFVFLTAINYVGLFHLIPLMPVFCIAAGTIIVELHKTLTRIRNKKKELQSTLHEHQGENKSELIRGRTNKTGKPRIISFFAFTFPSIFVIALVAIIVAYGFATSTSFILANSTNSFFNLYTNLISHLHDHDANDSKGDRVSIIGPAWFRDYYWIPRYVFNKDIDYVLIGANPKTNKFLLLADREVMKIFSTPESKNSLYLQQLFKFSTPVGKYEDQMVESLPYPYLDIQQKREIVGNYGGSIEMRANY